MTHINFAEKNNVGEPTNTEKIYALITTPDNLKGATSADQLTVEDETIWEGVEAGFFRVIGPLQAHRGAIVEMTTKDENEARWLLDSLVFVNAGFVQAELLMTANTNDLSPSEPIPSVLISHHSSTSDLVF